MLDKIHNFMEKVFVAIVFFSVPVLITLTFKIIWDPSPLDIKLLLTSLVSRGISVGALYLDPKFKEDDEKEA